MPPREHTPDVSLEEKTEGVTGQRTFRVLSGVLEELGIKKNDLITADFSHEAVAQVINGSIVIAAVQNLTGERVLLLRQFVGPYLLVTNGRESDIPIHMLKSRAAIVGLVVRDPYAPSQ